MTHDELLAKINELNTMKMWSGDSPMYRKDKALRAVVELTKTKGGVGMNNSFNDGWVTAMNTIFQAIEKELK